MEISESNRGTRRRASNFLQRAACLLIAAAAPTFVFAARGNADDRPTEEVSFYYNRLPAMAGGTETRANAIADLRHSETIGVDVWEHAVAGSARDAAGRWMPALWLCNNEVIEGPIIFVVGRSGGEAHGLAVDPNNPNVVYVSGITFDSNGGSHAALWQASVTDLIIDPFNRAIQGVRSIFLPYQQSFSGGVRVATGDIDGDGRAEIIVAGWSTTVQAPQQKCACIWISQNETAAMRRVMLPVIDQSGPSQAFEPYLSLTLEDTMISGFSSDSSGRRQATSWSVSPEIFYNPEAPIDITLLPGGRPSTALTETVGRDEMITIAGSRTNGTGKTMPAVWIANNVSRSWTGRNLTLPSGFNRGQANGIIAILIGLLVPGEMHGPAGASAALWHLGADGRQLLVDLNSLGGTMGGELHLSSADQILPYIEQDNLYKLIGRATGPGGEESGYVGVLRLVPR